MRLIKAKQAAEFLDIRLPRLYELARMRAIPSVRLGEKSIRFSEPALREFIERGGFAQSSSVSENLTSLASSHSDRE
jgi:excisionase family DNA binding protein